MKRQVLHITALGWASFLLLPGCGQVKGVFDQEIKIPEIIKVTVPTETVKPAVKEVPAPPPPLPAGSAPPVQDKLLPQQISPESPEGVMPVPPPAPPQEKKTPPSSLRRSPPPDFTYAGETITEDVAWHGEVLVAGTLTVAPQATLTLEPGTVARFRPSGGGDAGLLVQGRLVAAGTRENPVKFTSDSDGVGTGGWQGIVILADEKRNVLEHCLVEGAETGLDAFYSTVVLKDVTFVGCRTGIRLQDSLASLSGGGALGCDAGFSASDSEIDIRDAAFSGNRRGGVLLRGSLLVKDAVFEGNRLDGLAAEDSRIKLRGSRFAENGRGIALTACEGSVTGCRISKNRDCGIALDNSRVRVNGNEIAGNARVGILVEEGTGVAWGNRIWGNTLYDLYNAGSEDFRAMANWWGDGAAALNTRIYDGRSDGKGGRVFYLPVLKARPEFPF